MEPPTPAIRAGHEEEEHRAWATQATCGLGARQRGTYSAPTRSSRHPRRVPQVVVCGSNPIFPGSGVLSPGRGQVRRVLRCPPAHDTWSPHRRGPSGAAPRGLRREDERQGTDRSWPRRRPPGPQGRQHRLHLRVSPQIGKRGSGPACWLGKMTTFLVIGTTPCYNCNGSSLRRRDRSVLNSMPGPHLQ